MTSRLVASITSFLLISDRFVRSSLTVESWPTQVRRRDPQFPQRVREYDPSHEQPAQIATAIPPNAADSSFLNIVFRDDDY